MSDTVSSELEQLELLNSVSPELQQPEQIEQPEQPEQYEWEVPDPNHVVVFEVVIPDLATALRIATGRDGLVIHPALEGVAVRVRVYSDDSVGFALED